MSSQQKAGAVIYAKNISRVSEFYAGVVGLAVSQSETDHVVLESPAFQLVVHSIPQEIAASIEISNPPVRRTGTPIKLVFFVPSILASRAIAAKLGGELNPPEREWRFRQSRVCDGHDPEGNVLQLREIAG
jgi:predicted enzyme related to lactoylglutathione lyase